MNFRRKIFLLCIVVYMLTLLITGVVVTQNTYWSQLNKEIDRSLQEEKNIQNSAALFLIVSQAKEKISIEDYSSRIVDMFSGEKNSIEIFNSKGQLLSSKSPDSWTFKRDDIAKTVAQGKNYILRTEGKKHYLFINDILEINNEKLILCYIKDISGVDEQKREQYAAFMKAGLIGFLLIGLITSIMSKVLINPIEKLIDISKNISSGNYNDRVEVRGNDEVALLGEQFNNMASEVEKKIQELKDEGEAKQRFIDNLTHELRTPLTSVIGYSELLMNIKYDEENFHKGMNYINAEGKRMLKLINSLMDMILLRENSIEKEEILMEPLLREAAGVMKVKAAEKNIKINIKGENIKFLVNGDLIKGVIINLIDNAIKASKEKAIIEIGAMEDKGYYIIYVKDEGKGMSKEQVNKVMEPFYRVDKSRSRKEGGVGLGLSICKSVVEAHEGKIVIESKVQEGTMVKILFVNERDKAGI